MRNVKFLLTVDLGDTMQLAQKYLPTWFILIRQLGIIPGVVQKVVTGTSTRRNRPVHQFSRRQRRQLHAPATTQDAQSSRHSATILPTIMPNNANNRGVETSCDAWRYTGVEGFSVSSAPVTGKLSKRLAGTNQRVKRRTKNEPRLVVLWLSR